MANNVYLPGRYSEYADVNNVHHVE